MERLQALPVKMMTYDCKYNDHSEYHGYFDLNGKYSGKGIVRHVASGEEATCTFGDGAMLQGEGVLYSKQGGRAEGTFAGDRLVTGTGERIDENGDRQNGEFRDGQFIAGFGVVREGTVRKQGRFDNWELVEGRICETEPDGTTRLDILKDGLVELETVSRPDGSYSYRKLKYGIPNGVTLHLEKDGLFRSLVMYKEGEIERKVLAYHDKFSY